jgi:hypothetical protein
MSRNEKPASAFAPGCAISRGCDQEPGGKMGQMLAQTERAKNKPGPGRGKAGHHALPAFPGSPPTLEELGVTKRESVEAQALKEHAVHHGNRGQRRFHKER